MKAALLLCSCANLALIGVVLALVSCSNLHQVNPGAEVPIFEGASVSDTPALAGHLGGIYQRIDGKESIMLTTSLSAAPGVLLHEYQHLAEAALNAAGDHEGARILRHTFRRVCSPQWEMGHNDLMTEIPQ